VVGETLAHYRIVELVGRGGMGEVYRAEDTRLHRTVALKLLPLDLTGLDAARERLLREACAGSRLNHPRIATIYEVNEVGGRVFISMEFVEGESLDRRLARGPLPPDAILHIGAQVAEALEAAHGEGVVHRDVKPANILIDRDDQVKVVDFGLALEVRPPDEGATTAETAAKRLTRSGSTVGTVAYMSPEQARGAPQDFRTDLFSLGIVLYEMMTGALPFPGLTPLAQAAAIIHDDPVPIGPQAAHAPGGLRAIVERCLRKEPAQRPTAGQVRQALLLLRAGHATGRIKSVLAPRRWIAPAGAVAGVALLAAVTGLVGVWVLRPAGPDRADRFRTVEARRSLEQARSYEERGPAPHDRALAERMYRRALEIEPQHPLLLAHLARFLADLELESPGDAARRAEIGRLIDAAIAIDPEMAPAHVAEARLRLIEGTAEGALAAAQRAVALAPGEPRARIVLGDALIALGRTEEGIAELRHATGFERGHLSARARLAWQLFDQGRLDEAAAEYTRLLEYAPDSPSALNNLGAIALVRGNYVEAIKHFKRLLAVDPQDDYAASNLGMAYFSLDRMPEAIAAFHQAVELSPDDALLQQNLAEAHEKVGNREAATTWFGKALLNYDRDLPGVGEGMRAQLLAERAFCAAKLGRREEALRDLTEAAALEPEDMFVLRWGARVHALAADRSETFGFLERAVAAGYPAEELRLDPTFARWRADAEFLEILVGE
jgi:tetratricopeptide (TPR) repeat protein